MEFVFNAQPVGIVGENRVEGVKIMSTQAGARGPRGRTVTKTVPGTETIIPADAVVIAFGFTANPPTWLDEIGIERHPGGRVRVSGSRTRPFETTHSRVFAGGDMVRGADLVVTAVFEGREAARGILDYLRAASHGEGVQSRGSKDRVTQSIY